MKVIASTVMFLMLVNGLLLYMHYTEAGSVTAKSDDKFTYAQEIEVTNRPDGLYVRHHFKGLAGVQHKITWPKMSTKRSCYLEDAEACSRLNEESTAFLEGDVDEQSIMYVIPKDKQMDQSMLLENIFVVLDRSVPSSSLLHLTDEMGIGGLWVNGLKLLGHKKMDLINYSLFSGRGGLTDLYWQKNEPLLAYEGDRLTVFGASANVPAFQEADEDLLTVDAIHSAIVIDNDRSPFVSKNFMITDEAGAEKVLDLLLVNRMSERFLISKESRFIAEITSSLLAEKGIGSEKSRASYEELIENLTAVELKQLVDKVNQMDGEVIDGSILDEEVLGITGYYTSFFKKNNDVDTVFYPFLLEDTRSLYIDGEENTDIAVILKAGKTLYPATAIMSALEFEVRLNEQSLYIESEGSAFRFPLKELFYVHNERRYDLMSTPFEKIGDDFYFEEVSFIRIFIVGIEKTATSIKITPRTKFLKEALTH